MADKMDDRNKGFSGLSDLVSNIEDQENDMVVPDGSPSDHNISNESLANHIKKENDTEVDDSIGVASEPLVNSTDNDSSIPSVNSPDDHEVEETQVVSDSSRNITNEQPGKDNIENELMNNTEKDNEEGINSSKEDEKSTISKMPNTLGVSNKAFYGKSLALFTVVALLIYIGSQIHGLGDNDQAKNIVASKPEILENGQKTEGIKPGETSPSVPDTSSSGNAIGTELKNAKTSGVEKKENILPPPPSVDKGVLNSKLIDAVLKGDVVEVISLLQQGADSNSKNGGKVPILVEASYSGNSQIVRALIAAGANVNARDNLGTTPLMTAIVGNHRDVLEILLGSGANVDLRDNNGMTPLFYASLSGNADIVRVLIKYGANPNIKSSKFNSTPLIAAAHNGYLEVVRLLLRAGADPNAYDMNGYTALDYATAGKHKEIVSLLE